MIKSTVCFLILHYGSSEQTNSAVQSLLSLDGIEECTIVVLDNSSNYEEKDVGFDKIFVVKAEKNLGFSKGNNLGYSYIKENIDAKFIIAMNNDIEFPQKDFILVLQKEYQKEPFYVAGPDVYSTYKEYHSSPLYLDIPSREKIEEDIAKLCERKKYLLNRSMQRKIMGYIKSLLIKPKVDYSKAPDAEGWKTYQSNVVLQGSCLIFDRRFIDANEKLFYPETFLYMEESILTINCRMNSWNIRYLPTITVNHLTYFRSSRQFGSYRKYCDRLIARVDMLIDSDRTYLKAYSQYEKSKESSTHE